MITKLVVMILILGFVVGGVACSGATYAAGPSAPQLATSVRQADLQSCLAAFQPLLSQQASLTTRTYYPVRTNWYSALNTYDSLAQQADTLVIQAGSISCPGAPDLQFDAMSEFRAYAQAMHNFATGYRMAYNAGSRGGPNHYPRNHYEDLGQQYWNESHYYLARIHSVDRAFVPAY